MARCRVHTAARLSYVGDTMERDDLIDIGEPGAWRSEGLVRLDAEARRMAHHHAATAHGAETIRWFILDLVTSDPVGPPFDTLEHMLEEAESSLPALFLKRLRAQKGHLDDGEVGTLLGYATGYPVRNREWRRLRERVFGRIGLELGPRPSAEVRAARRFDIGGPGAWRRDVIRVLDEKLRTMAEHHAATDVGAQTIRWTVWNELTAAPREVELVEIERQLEGAEASLMGSLSDEVRRARGHLDDSEVARMVGFGHERPIREGYYRQLREDVFGRLVGGFGAVDLPEVRPTESAVEVGRQGAWKLANLDRLDEAITALTRAYARTEAGAQALRWHLLDQITADPTPVDVMLIDQRLRQLGASFPRLFELINRRRKRDRPFLSDGTIARFVGFDDADDVQDGRWKEIRTEVRERLDADDFGA